MTRLPCCFYLFVFVSFRRGLTSAATRPRGLHRQQTPVLPAAGAATEGREPGAGGGARRPAQQLGHRVHLGHGEVRTPGSPHVNMSSFTFTCRCRSVCVWWLDGLIGLTWPS